MLLDKVLMVKLWWLEPQLGWNWRNCSAEKNRQVKTLPMPPERWDSIRCLQIGFDCFINASEAHGLTMIDDEVLTVIATKCLDMIWFDTHFCKTHRLSTFNLRFIPPKHPAPPTVQLLSDDRIKVRGLGKWCCQCCLTQRWFLVLVSWSRWSG